MDNEYKFNVGDEVITIDGHRGEIIDICECERCQARGFCEPMWENETGVCEGRFEEVECEQCGGAGYVEYVAFSIEEAEVIMKHCGLTWED